MLKVTQSKSGKYWQVQYKGQVICTESTKPRAQKQMDKLKNKYKGLVL